MESESIENVEGPTGTSEEGSSDESEDESEEIEGEEKEVEKVEAEEEGELVEKKKEKKKKKKKAALKEDDGAPNYLVPGVIKVVLDEDTQTNLGIAVGIDITGEHPWKKIKKQLLVESLNTLGRQSPFFIARRQIMNYSEEEILAGYLLDETNDEDEFFICTTLAAKEYCEITSEEFHKKQTKNLEESVVKNCGYWKPMGTEKELNDSIVKYCRPLIRVEIKSKYPMRGQTDRFTARNANDVRDGYIELIPVKEVRDNLLKKRIDAQVQVTPQKMTSSAQTVPRFPRNMWTQCSIDDSQIKESDKKDEVPEEELTDSEKYKRDVAAKLAEKEREMTKLRFRDFLFQKVPDVERLMDFNSTIDIYNLDYPNLVQNEELCKVENLDLRELIVFSDKRTKNKYVSSVTWHPLHTQYVAVSYTDSIPCVVTYASSNVDPVKRAIYGENPVLVWSVFDSLKPKYYFESTSEVSILSLCIFDEDLIIGGCLNGQIVLWDAKILGEEEPKEILSDVEESNRLTLYSGMTWMKKIHDRHVVRTTVSSDLLTSHDGVVTDISWVSSHYEFDNYGRLTKLPPKAPRSKQFISSSHDGSLFIWDLRLPEEDKIIEQTKSKLDYPKVLIFEKSPYKVLKGKFKPIFRIITEFLEKRSEPLLRMTILYPFVNKLLVNLNDKGEREVSESVPDELDKEEESKPLICLCTLYGEYLRLSWGGKSKDVTTGEFVSRSKFHGGILVACVANEFFKDIVATVGGNVMAIWRGENQDQPIMWKYMKTTMKSASWSKTVPSQIYTLDDQGNIDIWDFLERSDIPVRSQTLTGTFSTGIYPHTLFNKHIMAIPDSSASLGIYSVPRIFIECTENDTDRTNAVFDREHDVKFVSSNWSSEFYEKNPSLQDRSKKLLKRLTFEEETKRTKPKKTVQVEEHGYGFQGEPISDKLPESLRRLELMSRMWKKMQWDGVELAIAIRKALNTEELLMQEKPLRDIDAQKRSKRKKMIDAIENRNKVFEESVELLFPEAVPKIIPPPILPSAEEVKARRENILSKYSKINKSCKSRVKRNPYVFGFSWDKEISFGKERSLHLNDSAKVYEVLNEKINWQMIGTKKAVVQEEQIEEHESEIPQIPSKKLPVGSLPPSPVLTDDDDDDSDF